MSDIIIVHNPLCSKSQKTLSLIQEKGIEPKIIEYLKGELTLSLLKNIINALNVHPKDIIRTSDVEFQKLRDAKDWQQEIANRFSSWLNYTLSDEKLVMKDVEYREWSMLVERKLALLKDDLKELAQ